MTSDWSFSFAYGDDLEDSDTENDACVSRQQPPEQSISEDTRLVREIDISTREDTALFQKNPWSIAKLNAATRPKPLRPNETSQPKMRVSTPKLKAPTTPSMSGLQSRAAAPTVIRDISSQISVPKPVAKLPAHAPRNHDVTNLISCKPISSPPTNLRREPMILTLSTSKKPNVEDGSTTFLDDDFGTLPSKPPLLWEPQFTPKPEASSLMSSKALYTREKTSPLPLRPKRVASSEQFSSEKKRKMEESSARPVFRDQVPQFETKPLLLKKPVGNAALNSFIYEDNADEDEWSTLRIKSQLQDKGSNKSISYPKNTFKLPNAFLGVQSRPQIVGSRPAKKTMLTVYQPPPPKIKLASPQIFTSENANHPNIPNPVLSHHSSPCKGGFLARHRAMGGSSSGGSGGSDDI